MEKFFIGQMSGTSLDGIDTVLCRSTKNKFEIVSSIIYLTQNLYVWERLINESFCTPENIKLIENQITNLYIKSVNKLLHGLYW